MEPIVESGGQNRSANLGEEIEEEGVTITVSDGDFEYNLGFPFYDSEIIQEDSDHTLVTLERKDNVAAGVYESIEDMLETRNIHQPDGVSVTTTREKNNLEYTEEGKDYLFLEHAYEIIEEETGMDVENLLTP